LAAPFEIRENHHDPLKPLWSKMKKNGISYDQQICCDRFRLTLTNASKGSSSRMDRLTKFTFATATLVIGAYIIGICIDCAYGENLQY
jgi:hypothetical protein